MIKKGSDKMSIPEERLYTNEDYDTIPEEERTELIEGRFYTQAALSRIHQEIITELVTTINNFIKSN